MGQNVHDYGWQRNSSPLPPDFQPQWHPTHVIYKTPTNLQTWTLRIMGSFRKNSDYWIEQFPLQILLRRKTVTWMFWFDLDVVTCAFLLFNSVRPDWGHVPVMCSCRMSCKSENWKPLQMPSVAARQKLGPKHNTAGKGFHRKISFQCLRPNNLFWATLNLTLIKTRTCMNK